MTAVRIEIYHGGKMVSSPTMTYVGGSVVVGEIVDIDKIFYKGIRDEVEDMGYQNIDILWWMIRGESLEEDGRSLTSDEDVLLLLKRIKDGDTLQVFVEHTVDVVQVDEEAPRGFLKYNDEHGGGNIAEPEERHVSEGEARTPFEECNEDNDDEFCENIEAEVNEKVREWVGKSFVTEDFGDEAESEYADSDYPRHAFNELIKCDSLLNNVSESFNSWVLGAREKPIITLLETIRIMMMKRFQQKRDGMKQYNGPVCPRIQKKLEKSKKDAKDCICKWGGSARIEVHHCRGNQQVVDLEMMTCPCRIWQMSGIPCSHACAAIIFHSKGNGRVEDFVNPCYCTATFLSIYEGMIEPVPGPELWPRTGKEPLHPPKYKKQPGRPKMKRRREEDELPNPYKLKRSGTQLKCGRCGGAGHNVRSCKGQLDEKRYAHKQKEAERLREHRARAKARGTTPTGDGTPSAPTATPQTQTHATSSGMSNDFGTRYTRATLGNPEESGQLHCRSGNSGLTRIGHGSRVGLFSGRGDPLSTQGSSSGSRVGSSTRSEGNH